MAKTNYYIKEKLSFKERVRALGNLPRFFKLVWQTSKRLTIANSILRIIRSAMPLAMLYIGKLIVDQVVMQSRHSMTSDHYYIWKLVGIELLLAVLSDVLTRSITLMDSLLGDLFANHTSISIMKHAATLDLDQFEDAVFYDKLERARQQTTGRTILLSQVL
ncbi:MAG TPA: hypothetical protein VNS32_23955, partial [Flavisolibacter sp.]|nr:hypothetical protein [Flavisolibacter sp.]